MNCTHNTKHGTPCTRKAVRDGACGVHLRYPAPSAPSEAKVKVAIVGPCSKGVEFHIHAAGCADVKRDETQYGADQHWTTEASTKLDVVGDVFGPAAGSFYEESGFEGTVEEYLESLLGNFHFAPCCKALK